MLPLLLVAAVAAAAVHLLALRASPFVFDIWRSRLQDRINEVDNARLEEARIVVRRPEAPEEAELPPPEEPQEMEAPEPEPQEIDLIDAQVMI